MCLLAKNGSATGSVRYRGKEILGLPRRELNKIRGVTMSMIFQDPMTSLNPYLRISRQMTEVLVEHKGMTEAAARLRAIDLLDRVGIPSARDRFDLYPHEFSGGMRQRVMIAMRSEEHTSELQSLMRISYDDFCLKKKNNSAIEQTATHT